MAISPKFLIAVAALTVGLVDSQLCTGKTPTGRKLSRETTILLYVYVLLYKPRVQRATLTEPVRRLARFATSQFRYREDHNAVSVSKKLMFGLHGLLKKLAASGAPVA